MNCFEWHSRSSDFLDGSLIGETKVAAEKHLSQCKECSERHNHYRILLSSIANQSRSTLPIPIRKAPLTPQHSRRSNSRGARSKWERIPWYLRTIIEGISVVLLILLGISAGPRIRAIYERNIEQSVTELSDTFNDPENVAGVLNTGAGSAEQVVANLTDASQRHDEFSGEDEGEDAPVEPLDEDAQSADEESNSDSTNEDIRVGNSEIWRFNVKTDSPEEIRPKIVQALTDLKIPTSTPGIGGTKAPGGIQFDLIISKHAIPGLKRQLQKIAPPPPEGLSNTPIGETFAWYKIKSRRKIPEGKSRVVIWISQM